MAAINQLQLGELYTSEVGLITHVSANHSDLFLEPNIAKLMACVLRGPSRVLGTLLVFATL